MGHILRIAKDAVWVLIEYIATTISLPLFCQQRVLLLNGDPLGNLAWIHEVVLQI